MRSGSRFEYGSWPPRPSGARAGDYWLLSYYLKTTSRAGAFDEDELEIYKASWAFEQSIGKTINTYRAPPSEFRNMTTDGRPLIPVRIIWGDRDAFVPLAGSILSEAYLPKGEIRHWPEESHWILHEEPERTANAMIEFFSECCGPGAVESVAGN